MSFYGPWNPPGKRWRKFSAIDFNFTQTAATGSITLHNYSLSLKTSTGF